MASSTLQPVIYNKQPRLSKPVRTVDAYTGAVKELFFLTHPHLKPDMPETAKELAAYRDRIRIKEAWVYYPAKETLVRTVDERTYFQLRTARNKNLITEQEQSSFRNLSIGIAGLSVGSCVLSALVMSGGPQRIKIADFDALELTNLNRIRGKLSDVGREKIEIAAEQVWDLDPFAKLELFRQGINERNLKNFLLGKPKLNLFIDEMDSLPLKFQARLLCRRYKIPVVMATDNGDSVVLDVERFDQEPHRKIFHGLLGDMPARNARNLTYGEWLSLATKIVGAEYLTPAMQMSLLEIGKSLPAVPQLGAIAGMAGAAICLALRRIASGQPMPSGRYVISLEDKLLPDFHSKKNAQARKKQTAAFIKSFRHP